MGIFLDPEDLDSFVDIEAGKIRAMIEDAEALAMLAASCLKDTDFRDDPALMGAVKAVLRGAILRWNDTGSGAISQVGAGSFQQSIDTRTQRRSMFWPSEIDQLRALCTHFRGGDGGAFTVNMTGIPTAKNPLAGAVINADPGSEPWGQWSPQSPPPVGDDS